MTPNMVLPSIVTLIGSAPFWMPDINTSFSDFHTPCGNSEISLNTENPAALSHATTFLLFIFGSSLLKLKNDLPFTLYTFLAPLISCYLSLLPVSLFTSFLWDSAYDSFLFILILHSLLHSRPPYSCPGVCPTNLHTVFVASDFVVANIFL